MKYHFGGGIPDRTCQRIDVLHVGPHITSEHPADLRNVKD